MSQEVNEIPSSNDAILIVDDDANIRQSMAAFLEDHEYGVCEASSGEEGVRKFLELEPALVFLDLHMPGMDGLAVLEKIKAEDHFVPVVMVSGANQVDDAVLAMQLGAWGYIHKPILDMQILLHTIERALTHAKLLKENERYRIHLEEEVTRRTQALQEANTQLSREIYLRAQTQEALEASEQRLNAILRTIPDIVYRLDADGRFSFINDAVRKYGYRPEELLGTSIFDIIHPDDRSMAQFHVNERRTGKRRTYAFELRIMTRARGTIHFELESNSVSLEPIFLVEAEGLYTSTGEEKSFLGTQGIARDVTHRKRAELALRESMERLNLTLQATNDGIWDFNPQLMTVYFSPRWFTMLGYDPEELPHSFETWENLLHPEDHDRAISVVQEKAVSGEPFVQQFRMKGKHGNWCWIQSRGRSVAWDVDGRPTRVVGTHTDITAQKKAETQLERLATAIEQAVETIVVTDPEGMIQYINPAFERMTGYARQEILGHNVSVLESKETEEHFAQGIWEVLRSGNSWTGRLLNRRKDGTTYPTVSTISPVCDSKGSISSYVMVQRDVTKEMELETQLRQAQKMEAVGQLAGGVAHDFNNLLQAIEGYSSMVWEDLSDNPEIRADLEQVMRAASRASTLVRQLLTFSRRQPLKPKNINLNSTVSDAVKMLRRLLGEHIDLRVRLAAEPYTIFADPGQVEQMLINLCVNARDAMPDGGVITISSESVVLDGAYCTQHPWAVEGEYAVFSVADAGVGMSAEVREHIFEPFFTTKAMGKGTGLGLATVYSIVQQHHGLLEVQSSVGDGTTFRVFLPLTTQEVGEEVVVPATEARQKGSGTILLAEDDEFVRNLAVQILQRAGYKALVALDGEEAVALFRAHASEIDLCILDVVMPKMSGRAAYEEIAQIVPEMKVMFSTGYSHDALEMDALPKQAQHLLPKPYRPHEMLAYIKQLLSENEGR